MERHQWVSAQYTWSQREDIYPELNIPMNHDLITKSYVQNGCYASASILAEKRNI